MSTKYINNGSYATSGYILNGGYQSITIGPRGLIGGPGLVGGTREAYTIDNAGRVYGSANGIYLRDGGLVTNASAALIKGYNAINIDGGTGTITNAGTLDAIGTRGSGIYLSDGGDVTNSGTAALITGYNGIFVRGGAGIIINLGVIDSVGTRGRGIYLQEGGSITNDPLGVIESNYAVQVGGTNQFSGIINNYGTIVGRPYALTLGDSKGILIVHPGSKIIGRIEAQEGTIELAGTSGSLSESLIGKNYGDFGVEEVLPNAIWTSNYLSVGNSLIDNGVLTVVGTSSVNGKISGAGTLLLSGVEYFKSGASLTAANVVLSAGTASIADNLTFGTNQSFLASGGVLALDSVFDLKGAAAFTGGTITDAGTVQTRASASVSAATVAGGALWEAFGTVTDTGLLTLGNAGGGTGRLSLQAGSAFDITANGGGIAVASGGSGSVLISGLLEMTGTPSTLHPPDLAANISTIAASVTDAGTIEVASGTLDFTGLSDSFAGTVAGPGTIEFGGGESTLKAGTALDVSYVVVAGSGTVVTLGTNFSYAGDLSQSGGTIALGANKLTLTGTATLAGTLGGTMTGKGTLGPAGTLDLAGNEIISAGAVLAVANLDLTSGTVTLAADLSYKGNFIENGGTSGVTLVLNQHTLDISGTATFEGPIGNGNTAVLSLGDSGVLDAGTTTLSGDLAIEGSETLSTSGTITQNGGTLVAVPDRFIHPPDISIGVGKAYQIYDDTSIVDASGPAGAQPTFINAGMLSMVAESGTVAGSGTAVIGIDLVDTGLISVAAGGTLALTGASNSFSAGGTTTGSGTIGGAGTVELDGGDNALNAGTTLSVMHVMIANANTVLTLGTNLAYKGDLTQAAGTIALGGHTLTVRGTFDILDDTGTIVSGGTIVNSSLFEKTAGRGPSTINAAVSNTGTIAVTAGTLELEGAVGGAGTIDVAAGATTSATGTVEFDSAVASGETINFDGTIGGVLMLNEPAGTSSFAGVVAGFGGGDEIDLTQFAYGGKITLSWASNSSGGILTVTDVTNQGKDVVRIAVFGQYQSAFTDFTDGHGGIGISYTAALPAQVVLAAPHH